GGLLHSRPDPPFPARCPAAALRRTGPGARVEGMHTPRPQGQLRTDPPPSRPARISAVEPADLVSYIQHTLGFVPRNSIAAITLADRCLGAVLRCDWDLSLGRDPTATTAYARQVAGYL